MRIILGLCALALAGCATTPPPRTDVVEAWLTTADKSALLAKQAPIAFGTEAEGARIGVDPSKRFQKMVGFGASITDASAWLIQHRMNPSQREALMNELFGRQGLKLEFTRVTVGASDFSRTHYSYNDRPKGETDPTLAHFSIAAAKEEVLPTVRAARAINPKIALMMSPWSAPGWMKSTDSLIKGTLKPEAYAPFAAYLRRTAQEYEKQVGSVDYLSIQNEPDFEPENYPGMRLSPAQRAEVIGRHVGPEFARAKLGTKILDWDHNWDKPEQPLGVLADPVAAKYVSGVAWHCYGGDVAAQSQVRDKHPDKDVFFTECSGGNWSGPWADSWAWTTRTLVIGSVQHWARGVLLWNLALDENYGPHLGGCGDCRGVVTIDNKTGAVTRNPEYYALGHASKFVEAGAWRIASTSAANDLETVAFLNPDGSRVLLAFNAAKTPTPFTVEADGRQFGYTLAPNAAVTFRWRAAR